MHRRHLRDSGLLHARTSFGSTVRGDLECSNDFPQCGLRAIDVGHHSRSYKVYEDVAIFIDPCLPDSFPIG
jgi:hypothetical protein